MIWPAWFLSLFGKPHPLDPKRPMTTLETAWQKAGVTGRAGMIIGNH